MSSGAGDGTRALLPVIGVLAGARLVINSAQRFVYPFLPAIARGLGIPLEQAGLLVSSRWMVGLAAPVIVTTMGRNEARKRLAVLGLGLFALGAFVTAATNLFVGALAGFILIGLGKPVFDVAAQAYIADRTPYHRRARYLSIIELTWAGGLLVGAPAAGVLIDLGNWATPFWVIGVLAVGALAAVMRVMDSDHPGSLPEPTPLAMDRMAWALLAVAALFSTAAELMTVVLGAWLEDVFGLSLLALGGIGTIIALAELAGEGGTLAFTDRLGKRRAVALGLVVSMAGFLGVAALSNVLVGGVAALAVALAGFELSIVSAIPLASEIRPGARTRYLAWMTVSFAVGRTIGAAFGPLLFTTFGLGANAAAALVADTLAIVILFREVRD